NNYVARKRRWSSDSRSRIGIGNGSVRKRQESQGKRDSQKGPIRIVLESSILSWKRESVYKWNRGRFFSF
ncbi:unnamed protein product, partial [Arabidopsis halleri]